MKIEFTDNSERIKGEIDKAVQAFLYEVSGEIISKAQDNSRVDTGQTKNSYTYKVINDTAYIGSNYMNAIWEELGTGEFAQLGNGRKGGWRYKDAEGNWHFTNGKTPNRPLQRAYNELKGRIKNRLKQLLSNRS